MDSTRLHKVSAIVVSENDSTRVYKSLEDVPEYLRNRLNQSVSDGRAATLLIADEGGRREILRKLEGGETAIDSAVLTALAEQRRKLERRESFAQRWQAARIWLEVLLIGCLGLAVWMLLASR